MDAKTKIMAMINSPKLSSAFHLDVNGVWDAEREWLVGTPTKDGSFYYACIEGSDVVINQWYSGTGWVADEEFAEAENRKAGKTIYIAYRSSTATEAEPPFKKWWTTGPLRLSRFAVGDRVYFMVASDYEYGCSWPKLNSYFVTASGQVEDFWGHSDGIGHSYSIRNIVDAVTGKPIKTDGLLSETALLFDYELYSNAKQAEESLLNYKVGVKVSARRSYYFGNSNTVIYRVGWRGLISVLDTTSNTAIVNFTEAAQADNISDSIYTARVPLTCLELIKE